MANKRAVESDPEEEEEEDVDDNVDQVMDGDHDALAIPNNADADANGNPSDMEEVEEEAENPSSPSPLKTRTGLRKRRRSLKASELTPPPGTRKKAKRARTSTKADTQKPAALFANPVPTNGEDLKQPASVADHSSPEIAADPRHISHSTASVAIPSNFHAQGYDNEPSENKEDSEELNIILPKHEVHINGTTQNNAVSKENGKSLPNDEAMTNMNGGTRNHAEAYSHEQSVSQVETTPQEINVEEKEVIDQSLEEDLLNDTKSTSTGASALQRLALFVILGFMSLLVTMPQVIKLSQIVVPLDDSILPQAQKLPAPTPFSDNDDDGDDDDDDDEPETIILSEDLKSWNKQFSENFEGFSKDKMEYSLSNQDFADYYTKLMDRIEEIQGELFNRQEVVGKKLDNLNRLEKLMAETEDQGSWEQARDLGQLLLGKTLVETSSIPLWSIPKDLGVDCILEEEEDDHDDDDDDTEETESEPLLSTQLLEEKESDLILRSTMTAEKFIGGAVATDRIRNWIKSKITEAVEEEMTETFEEMERFVNDLAEIAVQNAENDDNSSETASSLDLKLIEIIQNTLDVHRADITGIFDHASLKNGADIIYGGKRGTSKSSIDSLPIVNRILQTSNLRFYGFGPEAALTPTYPPNALGQCWAFEQTPLKEQLRQRELFEKNYNVPNDFKRGNFGTLSIRLPSPILVESVIIEHPPIHLTDQADSAIRSFRVVGYEDGKASSKAWNLGSFEYSLGDNKNRNEYIQEFEVASTVFGKEIPPLHSISLAIDSNYGHEYACLYRFRVHGTDY